MHPRHLHSGKSRIRQRHNAVKSLCECRVSMRAARTELSLSRGGKGWTRASAYAFSPQPFGRLSRLSHSAYFSCSPIPGTTAQHVPMSEPSSPPLTLRPFRNADAAAVATLLTTSVRGLWHYRPEHFQKDTDPEKWRLVALRGGEMVATGRLAPFGDSAPDALRLDLAGDGAAFSRLYLALLAQAPGRFRRLLGVTREDWPEQMHFRWLSQRLAVVGRPPRPHGFQFRAVPRSGRKTVRGGL